MGVYEGLNVHHVNLSQNLISATYTIKLMTVYVGLNIHILILYVIHFNCNKLIHVIIFVTGILRIKYLRYNL